MAHTIRKPEQAMMHAYFIWGTLLVGTVMFLAIGTLIASGADPHETHGEGDTDLLFLVAAFAFPFVLVPIGLFARGQMMKRGWVGDVVTPSAYLGGCVVAWACTEAAALFASGTMMLSNRVWPNVIPAVLCLVILVLLRPNGRAMYAPGAPHPPGVSGDV